MPLSDKLDPSSKRLLPGPHITTLHEIEKLFVHGAPHSLIRAHQFTHLQSWILTMKARIPVKKFWIDGSFVTLANRAPADIDVVAFVKTANYSADIEFLNRDILTQTLGGHEKIKPANYQGMLDTYACPNTQSQNSYWWKIWSGVRQETTREIIDGLSKGFLEVRVDD